MKPDNELDTLLSKEEGITPSYGFTDSVMRAITAEAFLPPPIPFPWKRAIPGLISAILLLVFLAYFSTSAEPASAATQVSSNVVSALNAVIAALGRNDIQVILEVSVLTYVIASLTIRVQLRRK